MVTEAELEELLRRHHWTLGRGRSGKQQVFSAKRHRKGEQSTRYIGTERKLQELTKDDVLEKLSRPPKTR